MQYGGPKSNSVKTERLKSQATSYRLKLLIRRRLAGAKTAVRYAVRLTHLTEFGWRPQPPPPPVEVRPDSPVVGVLAASPVFDRKPSTVEAEAAIVRPVRPRKASANFI